MAIRTRTRTGGTEQLEDELQEIAFRVGKDGATEVWCEWRPQMVTGGARPPRRVRCSPDVEARILASPNVPTLVDLAANDTHQRIG